MTHLKQTQRDMSPSTSFTITQPELGLPLQFEPAVGSKELDDLIDIYIPGPATSQQKRAQVALEFFNAIEFSCCAHPVSLRYNVTRAFASPRNSDFPWLESISIPSNASIVSPSGSSGARPGSLKQSGSLKRARTEISPSNSSPAKRLPGFTIMTKDGVDITDHASRGPKTKEQRDHAALMRKLKACTACKRSKQRCDPSHHRRLASALQSPISLYSTCSWATPSSSSSIRGSRGSISPQSSLEDSFSESPASGFLGNTNTHVGQVLAPLPTMKSISPPSDLTLPDSLYADFDLSTMHINPELLQLADVDLDSWFYQSTAFPDQGYANPSSYQSGSQLGFQSERQGSYQPQDQSSYQSESQVDYLPVDHLGYQSDNPRSHQSEDQLSYQSRRNDSGSYPRNPDPDQPKYIMYGQVDKKAIFPSTVSSQSYHSGQESIIHSPSLVCLTLPGTSPGPAVCSRARPLPQTATLNPANCTLGLKDSPVQDHNSTKPLENLKSAWKPRSLTQRLLSSFRSSLCGDLGHLLRRLMSLTLG